MIRIVAIVFLMLASCHAPKPVAEQPPQSSNAIHVVVPAPAQATATFVVLRRGQEGYDRVPTEVRDQSQSTLVPLGEEARFAIAASETELQRIRVDGVDYLLEIRPGSEVLLSDNPCSGWALSAASSDPNLNDANVVCVAESSECPEQTSPSPLPGLADDPLCAGDERRCARTTTVAIDGESAKVDGDTVRPGDSFEVGAAVCTFSEVATAKDRVRLFPPIGSQWTITVRDARISGRVGPPSSLASPRVLPLGLDSPQACERNEECTLTSINDVGCCSSCTKRPVRRDWLQSKTADCATQQVQCPPDRCELASPLVAICLQGLCRARAE